MQLHLASSLVPRPPKFREIIKSFIAIIINNAIPCLDSSLQPLIFCVFFFFKGNIKSFGRSNLVINFYFFFFFFFLVTPKFNEGEKMKKKEGNLLI